MSKPYVWQSSFRCLLNPIMLSRVTGYHFYFNLPMVSFKEKKNISSQIHIMHIYFTFFLFISFSSPGSIVITNSDLTIMFANFSHSRR